MQTRVANHFDGVHNEKTAREDYRERLEPGWGDGLVRPERQRDQRKSRTQKHRGQHEAGKGGLRGDKPKTGAGDPKEACTTHKTEEATNIRITEGVDAIGK